jgi:hypothetical protein
MINTLCRLFVLCNLWVFGLAAQEMSSQFLFSGGIGFDQYSSPRFSGEVNFGVKLREGTYSTTGYSMLAKSSTATTGVMQQFYHGGRITLYALGAAGGAMSDTNAGTAAVAGGAFLYDLYSNGKATGVFVYGTCRAAYSSLAGWHPVFLTGIGWRSQ